MLGWWFGPCPVLAAGAMHSRCSSLCLSHAAVIVPETLIMPAQNLLSCVQLVGYYGAALSVDYRWLGRKKLTTFSFLWVSPSSAPLLKTGVPKGLHGLECI